MARRREKIGIARDCPGCGHAVAAKAGTCGNCGLELVLPAGEPAPTTQLDDFEYTEFLEREFPGTHGARRSRRALFTRIVLGVVILALILALALGF